LTGIDCPECTDVRGYTFVGHVREHRSRRDQPPHHVGELGIDDPVEGVTNVTIPRGE
jgi:hypothetical protein